MLWLFNTSRDFKTVNGVRPTAAAWTGRSHRRGGMVFVNSGNGSFVGHTGNVLLAFGLD